jgi:hypothetical protein
MKPFSISAIALAATLWLAPVRAQQPATHDQHQPGQAAPQGSHMMDQDTMMSDMKAADARLETMVRKMNAAQGEEKIGAMQDVLNELVQNQVAMHRHMAMMHDHMMSQMPPK